MADMAAAQRSAHLRFTAADIDEMRRRRADGESLQAIADAFGTRKGYICALLSDRHGIRRNAPTETSPLPARPPVADRINLDLAYELVASGQSTRTVAGALDISEPSLRYALFRSKGRDWRTIRPAPAVAPIVAALVASLPPTEEPAGLASSGLTGLFFGANREN
jgi:hypothetical protein